MAAVLVAFASRHGSTREIAEVLAATLGELGAEVSVLTAAEVDDVTSFDAVILSSAVYHGRWIDDARHFLSHHRHQLEGRPTWLFSSGPTGGSPEADAALATSCGLDTPVPGALARTASRLEVRGHATFGGRIGPEATGMLESWMPRGDWRDLDQVRQWGRLIGAELQSAGGARRLPS